MEPLNFEDLPEDALVLIDSAPIIYFLEGHRQFGPRFKLIFEASALAINAAALVTYDRDFPRMRSLRIIS